VWIGYSHGRWSISKADMFYPLGKVIWRETTGTQIWRPHGTARAASGADYCPIGALAGAPFGAASGIIPGPSLGLCSGLPGPTTSALFRKCSWQALESVANLVICRPEKHITPPNSASPRADYKHHHQDLLVDGPTQNSTHKGGPQPW
jgi:hypothetical protein